VCLADGGYQHLSVPQRDPIPSEGHFIYWSVSVIDPETKDPMPRMRFRTYGAGLGGWPVGADRVLLFTNYEARDPSAALQAGEDADEVYCVISETDEDGHGEIFLCAGANQMLVGNILCDIAGQTLQPATCVVVDLSQASGTRDAPYPAGGDPVTLDGQNGTFDVVLPKYQGINAYDVAHLFCNGDYLGYYVVEPPINTPAATKPFSCYGLRSTYYDQGQVEKNRIFYYVWQGEPLISEVGHFSAEGPLPLAQMPNCTGGESAPAPSMPGNPDGEPINCDMIACGARIRIPLDSLQVYVGDEIQFGIYINGYRASPFKNQIRARLLNNPLGFVVTPRMLRLKYAEWWFQSDPFMGFGQNEKGDPGTFEARYSISRIDINFCSKLVYISDTLRIKIDTIPPGEYDNGGSDIFDANALI
jgi:hypothetical protein